jgi:hypothetical protein
VIALDGGPHGTTETSAAYTEAAHHPAYLLGVAQAAIRDALLLTDPDEIHAHLAEVLGRIKPEVAA